MLLIIEALAVTLSGISAHNSSVAVGREAISRVGDTTIESVLRYLEPAQQSADITTQLVRDDLISLDDAALEQYLYSQLAVIPQITGTFLGFPDGNFVFVSRTADGFRSKRIVTSPERSVTVATYDENFVSTGVERPTDDLYDPRTRPWYSRAQGSESVAWTDPYVFFSSKQPGVTAAKAVRRDGQLVAIVGVDVALSGLSSFLDRLAIAKNGQAFVLSGESVVAAPPGYEAQPVSKGDGTLRLVTVDELGLGNVANATEGRVIASKRNNNRELVLRRLFPMEQAPEWSLVVRAPESDFTTPVRTLQRATLLTLLGGAVLLIGAGLLMMRITRPLTRLERLAATDGLTGLANRRTITGRGPEFLEECRDNGEYLAVLMIDLDDFKTLNDRAGHHAGDEALKQIAVSLTKSSRQGDLVGRLGGDEFVVLIRAESHAAAVARGKAFHDGIYCSVDAVSPRGCRASAGVAISDSTCTFESILRAADAALLAAKAGGKGALRVDSEHKPDEATTTVTKIDSDIGKVKVET